MGYFDIVNEGLFTLFTGENKNLYFDAIQAIWNNCDDHTRKIGKYAASMAIITMLENHPEYSVKDGILMTMEDMKNQAAMVISTLKKHGWLVEEKEMIGEVKFYFHSKAGILYNAMLKMYTPKNDFEYINSVQKVWRACKGYLNKECSPADYYIHILKPVYDDTKELKQQMTNFGNGFKDMINELLSDMDIKKLNQYLLDVLSGKEMINYKRVLKGESGYYRYNQEIIKAIQKIKRYDLELFVDSYKKNVPLSELVDDPEEYIYDQLVEIFDFYDSEYTDLGNEMIRIVNSYLTRVKNKLRMINERTAFSEDPSDILMKLAGRDASEGVYSDERINQLFNLWKVKFVTEDSLTHNPEPVKTPVIMPSEEEEPETFMTIEEMIERMNKENQKNAENTLKYIKETYPGKRVIHSNDIRVDSMDDYLRLHDIIHNSLNDGFEYQIELNGEGRVRIGNCECTPFIIRKEKVK